MKPSKFSEETITAILAKYHTGEKIVNLCKEYGLSRSYFNKLLKCNKPYHNKYSNSVISLREVHKIKNAGVYP